MISLFKRIKGLTILLPLIFVFFSACTSSPLEIETDAELDATVANIPPPELDSVTMNISTQEITFTWTPGEIPDSLSDVELDYYTLYAKKSGDSNYSVFIDYIVDDSSSVSYETTNKLPGGLGTYTFRVQAVYELSPGSASNELSLDYTAYLGHEGNLEPSDSNAFKNPQGACITLDGSIYVADTENHRIHKFDSDLNLSDTLGSAGDDSWQFNLPRSVSARRNFLVVSDSNNDRVIYLDPAQEGEGAGFIVLSSSSSFNYPAAAYTDLTNNNFYVADQNNNQVQYSSNGISWNQFGSFGTNSTEFQGPSGIVADGNDIFVLDRGNARVVRYNFSGTYVSHFGSYGTSLTEFSAPSGIAIDADNDLLFVSDTGNNRIQVFDYDGNLQANWGQEGSDDGEFDRPTGIYYRDGKLVVADSGNNRVQVFGDD